MRYFKTIDSGFVIFIGTGNGGMEITEAEYTEILTVIRNKPVPRDGYDYKLKEDLSWDEYELPPIEPEPMAEDATAEDYEAALREVGVDV